MKKELKDYLHFYLGCKVSVKEGIGRFCEITSRSNCSDRIQVKFDCVVTKYYDADGSYNKLSSDSHCYYIGYEEIKPVLRPLSDMTEEEFYEFKTIADEDGSKMVRIVSVKDMVTNVFHQFDGTRFLISKQFDLFGLIEAGLAINKNDLKTKK